MLPRSLRRLLCYALTLFLTAPWSLLRTPLPVQADDQTSVFIEEVAWAGSSLSQADEWIELANFGTATATVGGWSVIGASSLPIFLPPDAEIAPGDTYRIANYAETDEKSALTVNIQITTTTLALSNSTLHLGLVDAAGTTRDEAGNGGVPPAGSSSPKASMIRIATSTHEGMLEWTSATSSQGFKTALSDVGLPGVCLLCPQHASFLTPSSSAMGEILLPETSATTIEIPVTHPTSTTDVIPPTSTSASNEIPHTTSTISQTPVPTPTPAPPLHFFLSEVVSNPAAGPEWVEISISETQATSSDRILELWDASGRIATVPAHTPVSAPGFIIITLSSARLNNGGDDLSLREMGGITLELTRIPALEDGIAWAKTASGSWTETDRLTPGSINQFPTPVVTPTTSSSSSAVPTPQKTTTSPSTTTSSTLQEHVTSTESIAVMGPRITVLLNEISPRPSTGKEWVELRLEESAPMTDRALELWDGSGRVATIPAQTPVTAPGLLVVMLSSARLNNDGDSLSLRETGGDLTLDTTEIPGLETDATWARTRSDAWTDTDQPTPGAENVFSESTEDPTDHDTKTHVSVSTTKTPPETSLTLSEHDMPKEPVVSMRVRLVGTVGSIPRQLGATHAFILLGEDGRAAIAYLPKHLNTPAFGTTVRVMGTLTATERQLELRMKTSDVWMTIATSTPPQVRSVDFLAPAMEDAWGLVAATGTVKTVASKSFVMDADGVDVTVNVPTSAGYRTQRLAKGDTVHVTGLLDPRKEGPTILIRVPEDIEIASHAPESITAPATETKQGLPDWTPFGAAAGAVAATGGLQRLRAYLKRRKLEALAASSSIS